MAGEYGSMPHVRVAASQQSGWRAVAASALTLLAFAVLAVHVSSRPGSAMGGVQLLDAVSAIGNEAPTSIAMAQPQPPIAGFPFGFDPVSGATQFMPMPGPYATGVMPPQAGPTLFPAPGSGYPGNAYVPSTTAQVALNTYQPYPYGPLPYGQVSPLVPYPQYATAPLTPYGMMQPAQTRIEITNNKNPVTVTVPQQPDWVNFPAVQLDPNGAPFGSTPNTAAAFNEYSTSLKPGVTFIPSVNYTFTRNFPIMPNIPPPVDLFTGTGPSGEAPYHIVGSVLSERPRDEDFSKQSKVEITGGPDEAMKQLRLQQLFGNGMSRAMDKFARTRSTRSTRKRFPRAVHQQLYEYHVPGGYLGGDGGIGSDYAAVSAPSEYFGMDEQGDAAFGEHGFGAADRSPIYQGEYHDYEGGEWVEM
mmetsp:Transcript_57012/g.92237  ORF Transcript_57012/g.92237 Transcript_57012/m.92237 type:complete len:416 (-) Transcript_57012:48-1295(-)